MNTVYADLDEMVFERRNKDYGAYEMRRKYTYYLTRAALIAFLLFLFATALPKVLGWVIPEGGPEENSVTVIPVEMLTDLPPEEEEIEEEPEPEVPPPPPVRAKIEFRVPTPTPDEEVEEEESIVEMEETDSIDVGLETVEGDPNAEYDWGEIDGTGEVEEVEVVEEAEIGPNDFVLLEKEPAPVNMDDLRKMIGYPPMAKEAEIEGKVILRVQVNKQGKYVKHITIKDPHPILTRAVTDKIKHLSFTPGIQAGKPIKVWVTIPFDFKLLK